MNADGRRMASADELARAREELRAAEQLLAIGLTRIAATRVYWAVFHAVRALLFAEGLEPRSHEGAHHLFNLNFVRTGRFEPATARLVARLQKYREEADYAEAYIPDEAGTREDLAGARELVDRVAAMVGSG